jgi:hypothetical protein
MIDIDVLSDTYLIMREYVSPKDRQTAADHLTSNLLDMGIDDRDLRKFASVDPCLMASLGEYARDDDELESHDADDYQDD